MHISAPSKDLLAAIQSCRAATEKRNTIPILSHILVKADGGNVTLRATDLEIEVEVYVPSAVVKKEGALAVPCDLFLQQVRAGHGDLEFVAKDSRASIKSGTFRSRIVGLEAGEFNPATEPPAEFSLSVAAADLSFLLRSTVFAATERDQFVSRNVRLAFSNGNLVAAATDGKRVCVAEAKAEVEIPGHLIVPHKAAAQLYRLVQSDPEAMVRIGKTENGLFFEVGCVKLCSGITANAFPNYERYLPAADARQPLIVKTADLQSALSAAQPFTTKSGAFAAFPAALFTFSDGVRISAENIGCGEFSAQVEAEGTSGLKIEANPTFIQDFLNSHDEEFTTILLGEGTQDLVEMRPGSGVSTSYRYFFVPLYPSVGERAGQSAA